MAHVIRQVAPENVDTLFSHGSTIGAYIIFPSNRKNNQMTINQARGVSGRIMDRFDLTLECIRLYYENITSPLSSVFHRYEEFFQLFSEFKGYVDFFLLQDLVAANYSSVKFHFKHRGFDEPPLPQNEAEYLEYMENTIKFVRARGKRIVASVSA